MKDEFADLASLSNQTHGELQEPFGHSLRTPPRLTKSYQIHDRLTTIKNTWPSRTRYPSAVLGDFFPFSEC